MLGTQSVSERRGDVGRRLLVGVAAIVAYASAVALLSYAVDADQERRGGWAGEEVTGITLLVVLSALQPVVGYALGWVAFSLLVLPVVGGWWVERDYEPGLFDIVPLWGLALVYSVVVGAPLTAAGVFARRSAWRLQDAAHARLWVGAVLTATAAVLFPRLSAALHEGEAVSELDGEAAVLLPVVALATLALFALVGGWAWRGESTSNRPARVGLVSGMLGLAGALLASSLSAPIVLGGLAVTLGLEGMRRTRHEGKRRHTLAAIALGAVSVLAGAAIWLAGA
jgi:hypothetical protein